MNSISLFKIISLIIVIFNHSSIKIYGTWFNESIKSINFIHRDIFLEFADFIFDPTISLTNSNLSANPKTFNPNDVKFGDIIFIRNPDLFFKTIGSQIKVPYIIVTTGHFTDGFKSRYLKYLKSNIISWFSIHLSVNPRKNLFNLPLGIIPLTTISNQKKFYIERFKQLRNHIPKNKWLYYNCKDRTNPIRPKIKQYFSNKPFCHIANNKVDFHDYLQEMAEFKFTLCPPGKGPDSYRTWEALMVGSIPIVQSSTLNDLYKDLPIIIVTDWKKITLPFLEQQYKEILSKKNTYKFEKLFVEYWINKIQKTKKRYIKAFNE